MDESYRESQERYQKGGSDRAKARQIDDWMSAILPTLELSSLRSQLEYWNTGIMGSGQMGQWFTLLNRVPSGKFNRVNWQILLDREINK